MMGGFDPGDMVSMGVVPVLIGPLQVLLATLPGILLALLAALAALFKPATLWMVLRMLWRMRLVVVCAVAVIVGGWYGARHLFPARGADVGAAEGAGETWPGFRGDAARRGWQPGAPDPVEPGIVWRMDAHDTTFYASPAVVGNRIYIASAEVSLFKRRGTAELYCLDADTGGVVWRSGPPGYRATFSSVAVGERHIAAGEGLHLTKDSRLTVMDRGTGDVLWTARTESHVESTPVIGEGRVLVGAGQDGFHCFALDPDDEGNPVRLWHAPGPDDYPDASGSPAIHEGRAYLPLGRWGGRGLACLDLETGEELWRVAMPYPVFSGPTFAHGRVYVGMGNGNFIQTAEQALPGELDRLRARGASEEEVEAARATFQPGGAVWSLDPQTGEVLWTLDTPRAVLGQIAAGEDAIYAATREGTLLRIRHDGRVLGTWAGGVPILASPALAESHVYVLDESGRLTCLDTQTLRPVWDMALGLAGPWLGSPTVARGRVYLGTPGGGVLAVGHPAGAREVGNWSGTLGGAGQPGRIEDDDPGSRGVMAWRLQDVGGEALSVHAPLSWQPDRIFIPLANPDAPGVLAIPPDTESRAAPSPLWRHTTTHPVLRSVAADRERVVVIDGATGDDGRMLYALDSGTGDVRWSHPVEAGAGGVLRLDGRGILAGVQAEGLTAFSLEGETRWHAPGGTILHEPDAGGGVLVFAASSPQALFLLDETSGTELWRMPLSGKPRSAPVLHGQRILLAEGASVRARSILDGAVVWERETGAVAGDALLLEGGGIWLVTETGTLLALDPADGTEQFRIEGVQPLAPLPFGEGVLYRNDAGDWMRVAGSDETSVRWAAAAWLGDATAPPIAAEGGIYLPTDAHGVIRWRRRE